MVTKSKYEDGNNYDPNEKEKYEHKVMKRTEEL